MPTAAIVPALEDDVLTHTSSVVEDEDDSPRLPCVAELVSACPELPLIESAVFESQ